jgi:CMP-N,N'-diacetyllegionaminic acid synthase
MIFREELMKHIAIITARSGSKGLKDKNIKLLDGKPLLAYTIEAAQESGVYDCIHVSTDSEVYADIARGCGADVPFLRSEELSGDAAGSWDVIRWVLEEYEKLGRSFDTVTLLQPTSPLRDAQDIRGAFDRMQEKQADAVVSVCEVDHSPLWSNTLPEDGSMNGFLASGGNARRQQLATYYRLNGAIYLVKTGLAKKTDMQLYGEKTFAYIMSKEHSVDIDDELDFLVAETVFKYHKREDITYEA